MPVQRGVDARGPFYRWGARGHKYYYTAKSVAGREAAKRAAAKQGRAIKASQGRR